MDDNKEYCPVCKKLQIVWWGVCDVCGYDITHPRNNKLLSQYK